MTNVLFILALLLVIASYFFSQSVILVEWEVLSCILARDLSFLCRWEKHVTIRHIAAPPVR